MRRSVAVVAALVVGLSVAGCGGDGDGGTVQDLSESESDGATTSSTAAGAVASCTVDGGLSTKGTDLVTTLTEYAIEPAATTVAPGIVSFIAENAGQEPHELAIVRGEDPKALPTDPDTGAVNDDKLGDALIGEIEPFGPGQLCRGNFALEAGTYVLLCNIVETEDDGTRESHFAEGMVTTLAVR